MAERLPLLPHNPRDDDDDEDGPPPPVFRRFATKPELQVAVDNYLLGGDLRGLVVDAFGYIGQWDVSDITDMAHLFQGAIDFNADIGHWDVSSVTNMTGMFENATTFACDIGHWDVSNVTEMDRMFAGAVAFDRVCLRTWNTRLHL
jgi:surface protein